MLVDLRPINRMRGTSAVDLVGAMSPVVDAVSDSTLELANVRMVGDWIQYRENFRPVVDLRKILPAGRSAACLAATGSEPDCSYEVAVDLRRATANTPEEITDLATQVLAGREDPEHQGVLLEDWGPTRRSCIWDFNALYWQALGLWERATGREYEQALPGGQSDARDAAVVRDLIEDMFTIWQGLELRHALPDELYVVELGVGNGHQARVWLDEFKAMDEARGTDYYRRLHYLMCDYSQHVLDLARETVAAHSEHVSSFALDATAPSVALGFLQYKVFLVYVSNVYDNLPTDEIVSIGSVAHLVESRAHLPAPEAAEIADSLGVEPDRLPDLIGRLLRLGPEVTAESVPEVFSDVDAVVRFWQRVWAALRLQERYVPLRGLDVYEIAPGISGEMLRPQLDGGADVRLHVNNGAIASFVDTLRLLHPYGKLICHDLFVQDTADYRTGFRGPGKYDGSVVNWNNGPLLAHIGRRHGFDVTYRPFGGQAGTKVVTMTAQARD